MPLLERSTCASCRSARPQTWRRSSAVGAEAERTGAHVLAEGIETPQHLAMARSLGATLGQGYVRGAALAHDDPVRGEWDVIVLGPHFSAALVARDLGDDGPEPERRFDFAVTYERSLVLEAALSAMSRIAPAAPPRGVPGTS